MTPYTVSITTKGGPPELAKEHTTDLAWEHALLLTSAMQEDLGSDAFVEIFTVLKARYNEVGEHFGYLQHFALRVIQELMSNGMGVVWPADIEDAELEARFHLLSSVVLSAIAWTYASGTEGWIPNSEWDVKSEEIRTIEFDVLQTTHREEGNAND